MTDELTVCAAAYFRSIGKDVTTTEEFVMSTSLEMKWMSPSDSKLALKMLLARGILTQKGEFIRPSNDLSALDVPLAYKPSPGFIEMIRSKPAATSAPAPKNEATPDLFHTMIDIAKKNGIETKDFVPACTRIQKRLGIDVGAAALIVLRDNGVDITELTGTVYSGVSSQ